MCLRPLRPEQGALGYARPVHRHLRRSATAGRRGRPRLNAADGRPPLPFRSQNRTQRWCAARGPGGWRSGATPTRSPTMLTSVHHWPPPFVTYADMSRVAGGEPPRTGMNEPRPGAQGWRTDLFAAGAR